MDRNEVETVLASVKVDTMADRITLFQIGPEGLLWTRFADGVQEPVFPFWTEIGTGVAGLAALRGTVVVCGPSSDESSPIAPIRDEMTGYETHDLLAVPVFNQEGVLLGVIECINRRSGTFSETDSDLVRPHLEALRQLLLVEDDRWKDQVKRALPSARLYLRLRPKLDWQQGALMQEVSPFSYDKKFSGFRDCAKEAKFLLDVISRWRPDGRRILDLACGTGGHSVELALLGFDVTGIDLDLRQITAAEHKAEQGGLDIRFLQADMCAFSLAEEFDLVFNFFYGMQNVLLAREQQDRCLACIRSALTQRGLLVLDFLNEKANLHQFPPDVDHMIDDGMKSGLRIRSRSRILNDQFKVLEMHFQSFSQPELEVTERYPLRRMYLSDAQKLIEEAGFRVLEVAGDFALGAAFDPEFSPRMIFTAEKI